MAKLEIKKFNNPVLRKKNQEVAVKDISTKETKRIVADMAETMDKSFGIGLAAPQIGINKRIIVFKAGPEEREVFVLFNPIIKSKGKEEEIGQEGCLSFPNIFLEIKRPREVQVTGISAQGEKITIDAEGVVARILQHEIDHLNGILFYDRLGFFKRMKFKFSKQNKGNEK
jgi:peptide deformylase